MTTDLATLRLLYDYNDWANRRLLEACAGLTPEQWDQPLGHSWGSVHGVLAHMLGAEMVWLARWKGTSPSALPGAQSFPGLEDLRRAWDHHRAERSAFMERLDSARLAADPHYANTRGQPFSVPLGQLMLHVANHGSHHRGELAAMLAMLDVPHPEDDLIFYLLEQRPPA